MALTLELTRILLRYLGMFLIAKGIFDPATGNAIATDPAIIEFVAGAMTAALAEAGWIASKVRGKT